MEPHYLHLYDVQINSSKIFNVLPDILYLVVLKNLQDLFPSDCWFCCTLHIHVCTMYVYVPCTLLMNYAYVTMHLFFSIEHNQQVTSIIYVKLKHLDNILKNYHWNCSQHLLYTIWSKALNDLFWFIFDFPTFSRLMRKLYKTDLF